MNRQHVTLSDCSTTAEVENELARIDPDYMGDSWQLSADDLSDYQADMVKSLLGGLTIGGLSE